jgi:3-mercaptopyruvate sulfurtransferase SseA
MAEARYRGQKVIAVAPDYADNVKFADEWLPAQPGTDGALAMAMGHAALCDECGAFRSAADLRGIFSAIDLDGDDELITYCTIGGRASTAWFVLTYLLGRDRVRVYDGSWAEWGKMASTPVE